MPIREELKLDAETEKFMSDSKADIAPVEKITEIDQPEEKTKEIAEPVTKEEVDKPAHVAEKEKTVPLAVLHEERRKFAERERLADERLRAIQEAIQSQVKPQTQQIPDLEKDPLGVVKMTQQQVADLIRERNEDNAQKAQQAQRQQVMSEAARQESSYIQQNPDYMNASNFIKQSRYNELIATGLYQPHEVGSIIQQEASVLAGECLRRGMNPAEIVYNIAKARGYAQKQEPATQTENTSQKINRIAEGQAEAKSIGSAANAASPSGKKMDARTLANMSDDDFKQIYGKLKRGDMKEFFGN